MRVVALEEHFCIPSLVDEYFGPDPDAVALREHGTPFPSRPQQLEDLGAGRVHAMDAAGISVQVLSVTFPGADLLEGDAGIQFARATNDSLAKGIEGNPGRFVGFAHLPMREPLAAADEVDRAISTLGFRGVTINGTTSGKFLDDPQFIPVLDRVNALGVPIYLHPNLPPRRVFDAYFDGLPGDLGRALAGGAYGWHVETGLHVLRLVGAKVFDRYPELTIIVGHMGESLPFMIGRAGDVFERRGFLEKHLGDLLREHLFVTTSGFFTLPPFLTALLTFGIDRIMFSVDYPWGSNARGREFLDSLPISTEDRLRVAHTNADRLLGLQSVGVQRWCQLAGEATSAGHDTASL